MNDKQVEKIIKAETKRQKEVINLIASENFVSKDVLTALGSVFTNKYAEGYPGARYYDGNEIADQLENICKQRALKLFKLSPKNWHVNTQALSGSPANLAVLLALVPLGEKIMGMELSHGGHLTHGYKVSFTGKLFKQVAYGVSAKTELLDYKTIEIIARKEKPKLIIVGYTAYSRKISFKAFSDIAKSVGAILMVDMSHVAGLVAGGVYSSPFKYADVVTTTTHKTLRGPRSALIFCKKEFAQKVDRAVFPGLQGGPHLNQIAAVAVALKEAMQPNFKSYSKQIIKNANALAKQLKKSGFRIISGETDTHLLLVDTYKNGKGINGKQASDLLQKIGIIVNKNAIPFDLLPPSAPSGIRLGTPAMTTLGFKEKDFMEVADIIAGVLLQQPNNIDNKTLVVRSKSRVKRLLYRAVSR